MRVPYAKRLNEAEPAKRRWDVNHDAVVKLVNSMGISDTGLRNDVYEDLMELSGIAISSGTRADYNKLMTRIRPLLQAAFP